MTIRYENAPEGALCERDLDPSALAPTPCGKPAEVALIVEGMSDDPMMLCEECRVARLRRQSQNEQLEAFEEQHGYPPNRSVLDLAHSLGTARLRYERLVTMQAPPTIIENEQKLIDQREHRIVSWLRHHSPVGHDTHLQAVDAVIERAVASYEGVHREPVLEGLKWTRKLAAVVDATPTG